MSFRLIVANVHNRPTAVTKLLALCDLALFSEAGTNIRPQLAGVQRRSSSWRYFVGVGSAANQMAHVWRPSKLTNHGHNQAKLMQGGHIAGGRRLGPNRYAVTGTFTDRATGRTILVTHVWLIAKSTTSARWRWGRMLASQARLRVHIAAVARRHPNTAHIVAGDTNLNKLGRLALGKGWRNIASAPDMGAQHFTQLYVKGDLTVKYVGRISTSSDHKALRFSVQ